MSFASRFLNPHEFKYSTNELELLGVLWAVEHYKNYLYGSEFEIITDHKALFSALSPNHGNKTYHSRLTRWVDRLLPFNFTIKHLAGKDMGFTDLIPRTLSGKAIAPSHYDEEFVVATTKKIYNAFNPLDNENPLRNSINSISENSQYTKLRNHVIITALNFVNSSISFCNQKHYRTEFWNSKCIPSDFSRTDSTEIFLSNSAFIYFLILNSSLITNPLDLKLINSVNMSNNQIVVNPSTSGIQVSIDFQISSEHKKLVTKFRESLKLPERPLDLNTLFIAKLFALLTEDDEMLNPIVKALQKKVENINAYSRYLHQFSKGLHESDGLLYMDGKLVIPFTLRHAVLKTLHESHPGQFGMKYLAQYIWWPHINRQNYFRGINCTQCTQTGKNIQSIIPTTQISELPALFEPNEELNLDFAGPLDNNWGNNKNIL